ncbi:hypothetical protein CL634_09630 [bacterium]|nr:hypothetical protein [bacterium]
MRDLISTIGNSGYEQLTGAGNTTGKDVRGFDSVAFVGTIATADAVNLRLQEADTQGGSYSDVASDQMYGDSGAAVQGEFKLGYTGYKRYVRLAKDAGTAVADSVLILGRPEAAPVA